MSTTAERPPATRRSSTIVTRLADRARQDPDGVALREKQYGIWVEYTWADYWDNVRDVAFALLALGVGAGDRVSVHAENRPEWVFADLGTIAIRGVTNGLYPTNPAAEVRYLLADSGTSVLIAEDQEQVDKALAVADDLPDLRTIVSVEPRGVRAYDDPRLLSWAEFLALGRRHREASPDELDRRMADARPEDTAVLIYTSGTTGPPKGAMLTVGNIEFAIAAAGAAEGGLVQPPAGPDDVYLSYLPISHVYERLLTSWLGMHAGYQIHFAESIDTVQADLREVQPTIFASVPRILEKIHAGVAIRMASASRVKRANYRVWSRVAGWIADTLVRTGGSHTPATRLAYAVGWVFLFRALKDRMGLRKCRHAVSGAAPIAPDILRWFMGVGVPIVEAYGQTEGSAIATSNRWGRVRLGTVGEPLAGVELRLDPATGEVLLRHGGVFAGYWNRPEATREVVDAEGWLHTGDVGEMVDGAVKIVDRLKDIIITAGGKNVSPSEIENSLKSSPYIREAVVVGDRRPYLSALVGIDLDTVGDWAQRRGIPYTTYRDLTRKDEVVALVQRAVDRTNEQLARVEQVKRFRLLPKELDHDQGELTATQKVKRAAITEQFSELIEDLYRSGAA